MKKFVVTIALFITLVGSVFAENHNKKYEKGVEICQQIANDYNIEVEVKKVSALPNNAAACCMKKGEGKFIIKLDWNYTCSMTDNIVTPTLIHEMAHAVTNNCGHNQEWVNAIYDLVDYFPYLNRYEAGIINQEVEKAE